MNIRRKARFVLCISMLILMALLTSGWSTNVKTDEAVREMSTVESIHFGESRDTKVFLEKAKEENSDKKQAEAYDVAMRLMEEEKYAEAKEAFVALNGYKDSEEQIKVCEELLESKYQTAKEFMTDKQYTKAIEAFKSLNGYEDSASLISTCESELKQIWGEEVFNIYNSPAGSCVKYGTYEQDGESSNGAEDIEWVVLEKDTDKVLLISRYCLDASGYTDEWKGDSWDTCSIRSWLNEDFMESAFTKEAMRRILSVKANKEEGTETEEEPEENEMDKVFLLNITELKEYFESDQDLLCEPTAYAKLQAHSYWGEDISKVYDEDQSSCVWWVRPSQSEEEVKTTYVFKNGRIAEDSSKPNRWFFVRPVLYINLDPNELLEEQEPVCEHQWTEATCTQASYCVLCGETNGEALGHYWIDDAWEDQYKAYLANTDPSQWKDQGAGYNYHWFCSRCHCLYLDGYYVGCEYSPFGTYEVTGNWLNVRSYPSTNLDNVVYKLNKGERIQVIGSINGWAAFWYSRENMSHIGWVSMDYLAYYSSEYRITNVW